VTPEAQTLARDGIAFARDTVVALCATALAWHMPGPETLMGATAVLGAIVGAHASTRGASEGARASVAAIAQSMRPPPPRVDE
jgi:hypothetical protein